jgi:hypothetical protein
VSRASEIANGLDATGEALVDAHRVFVKAIERLPDAERVDSAGDLIAMVDKGLGVRSPATVRAYGAALRRQSIADLAGSLHRDATAFVESVEARGDVGRIRSATAIAFAAIAAGIASIPWCSKTLRDGVLYYSSDSGTFYCALGMVGSALAVAAYALAGRRSADEVQFMSDVKAISELAQSLAKPGQLAKIGGPPRKNAEERNEEE